MLPHERKIWTLAQLGSAIQQRINEATQGRSYWISAEIASIKVGTHAYLELVQHRGGARVAAMRGVIWGSTLQRVMAELGEEARNILKDGVETLFLARPHYHLVHGLSLVIEAIDPGFTVSMLERRKQETIATLKREGLYDLNRQRPLPMVVQSIALVTSQGSAAYADFMQHLARNEHGYAFSVRVFHAAVQGDAAAAAMIQAFAQAAAGRFDAVVLVRGGGSRLDLEPFNDLELARALANMPVPVLTGIGHDTDLSVADLVAHEHHKTPTAVADWIVDHAAYFEGLLTGMAVGIQNNVLSVFADHRDRLARNAETLRLLPGSMCRHERGALHRATNMFMRGAKERLAHDSHLLDGHRHQLTALAHHRFVQLVQRLQGIQESIGLMDPQRSLERGFSIARHNGQAVLSANTLAPGYELEITLAQGKVWSTVDRTGA